MLNDAILTDERRDAAQSGAPQGSCGRRGVQKESEVVAAAAGARTKTVSAVEASGVLR